MYLLTVELYLAYTLLFAVTLLKSSTLPPSFAVYHHANAYVYCAVAALLGVAPAYVAAVP